MKSWIIGVEINFDGKYKTGKLLKDQLKAFCKQDSQLLIHKSIEKLIRMSFSILQYDSHLYNKAHLSFLGAMFKNRLKKSFDGVGSHYKALQAQISHIMLE